MNENNSVLIKRPLVNTGAYSQANDVLKYRIKPTSSEMTLSKDLGAQIRIGGFKYLEYQTNPIEEVSYLMFYTKPSDGRMEIDVEEKDNPARKLTIRSKVLGDYLIKDLKLTDDKGELRLSENISRREDQLTFRVTKR